MGTQNANYLLQLITLPEDLEARFSDPQFPSVLDPVMGTSHRSFASTNWEIKTT